METKRIKISDTKNINDEELKEAAQILRDGGLVAFPTETVYGKIYPGSRKEINGCVLARSVDYYLPKE